MLIRMIRKAVGLVIMLFGLILVGYDLLWLLTHRGSILGTGLALLLIGVGIVLFLLGWLIKR